MHSIRINQLNFLLFQNFAKTIKILIVDYVFCISEIVTIENFVIVYMKWLKKLILLKITEWFTIILKFTFLKTVNAIIIKFLIWQKKIYLCEKLFRNKIVKQCFNCWTCEHLKNQCFVVKKCDWCENVKHEKKICLISKIHSKCTVCENSHKIRHKNCRIKIVKINKIKTHYDN